MKDEKIKVKITCYTPKGKAEASVKTFGMKYFSLVKKPIERKLVSDREFYYIYEYKNKKAVQKIIDKKIPKAELSIRQFYIMLIHLIERGNKLGKKGAWKVEKVRRWIYKQLRKKVKDPKEYEDFINSVDLSDKDEFNKFLSGKLFDYEIIGEW